MGEMFRQPSPLGGHPGREKVLFAAMATIALCLLVITAGIINYQFERRDAESAQQNSEAALANTTTIRVPDREVAPGTKLSEVVLKEVYWPKNQLPPSAVIDQNELQGLYAKVSLPAGMPVQRESLTDSPTKAGLPVSPGNRAVTIEVDRAQSIEGYTTPGSVVDVVLTFQEGTNLTSKIIVDAARVLSLGGDSSNKERSRSAASGQNTITLDVSPQDALKIQTARQMGRLSLMLRSDSDRAGVQGAVSAEDFSSAEKVQKLPKNPVCTKGTMRAGSVTYVVRCDGTLEQVPDQVQP